MKMQKDNLDNFFEALITDEKELKILKLISKDLNEDEIIEILLKGENGGESP